MVSILFGRQGVTACAQCDLTSSCTNGWWRRDSLYRNLFQLAHLGMNLPCLLTKLNSYVVILHYTLFYACMLTKQLSLFSTLYLMTQW